MAFDYERIRTRKSTEGSEWTFYSDLFMCLSFLFLMLYVSTSMRTGTSTARTELELAQTKQALHELREQVRAYDSLNKEYLEKGASPEEQRMYRNLMARLTLLEDESNKEKEALAQKSQENAEKAAALNHYQRIIRNIINANMLAQSKIKSREQIIGAKENEIRALSKEVESREQVIANNNRQIAEIERDLERKIKELNATNQRAKLGQKMLGERIKKLREESDQKVKKLLAQNQSVSQQLQDSTQQLSKVRQIAEQKSLENQSLAARLRDAAEAHQRKVREMTEEHERKKAAEQKTFMARLAGEKLSAESRIAREKAYRAQVEAENRAFNQKLEALNQNLSNTKSELENLNRQKSQLAAEKTELSEKTQRLQGDLERAKALANYKRELADRIRKNLKAAGIEAEVNPKTGEVVLTFGNEYFETNDSSLKPGMRNILEKFVPTYAKSLFSDPKIANEIRSVELVGFASPTYKNRFVDPSSLNPADRAAVNYNLDLSYQRAKSIFNYIFDTKKIRYSHQEQLLPLVKVTGRSYLAAKRNLNGRVPASMNAEEFCRLFNCQESQRVFIKFNLEE